ncbi:MAG: GntR family transcriptional regulator [Lachnospiraceae bacterium]|nr:GntR family transcriptional regulator [Lachnospiraceae bacterium]
MIILDYQDRRAIYEQIVEKFELLILSGGLEPDAQLPSVRKLAVDLAINPNTIQKAFSILEERGYIYSIKGRGNFVSAAGGLLKEKKEKYSRELRDLLKKGRDLGLTLEEITDMARANWQALTAASEGRASHD